MKMRPSSKIEPSENRKLVPSSSLSSSSEPDHTSEDVDDSNGSEDHQPTTPADQDHDHDLTDDDDDNLLHATHRHPHSTQTSVDMGRFTNMVVEDLEIIDTIGKSKPLEVLYLNFHRLLRQQPKLLSSHLTRCVHLCRKKSHLGPNLKQTLHCVIIISRILSAPL